MQNFFANRFSPLRILSADAAGINTFSVRNLLHGVMPK